MSRIVLASSSPRRKELLDLLPIHYIIQTEPIDETMDSKIDTMQNVMNIAYKKAKVIAQKEQDALVIGCDTIVAIDGHILGKPKDKSHAHEMLTMLSNKWHSVYTGVSLVQLSKGIEKKLVQETKVHMKKLDEEEIYQYIYTGEPMDKAGAYGIQGRAGAWIDKIEGDYFNVMGLPISRLYDVLKTLGEISY